MLQLIEPFDLFLPSLMIPCRVVGILLLIAGIISLILKIRGKAIPANHPYLGAALTCITGVAFILSNLIPIIISMALWVILYIVLTILDAVRKQSGSHLIPWPHRKRSIRIGCDVALFLLLFGLVIPYTGGGYAYQMFFTGRFETVEMYRYHVEDYEGLICEDIPFSSDRGQTLAGYLYSHESEEPQRGVVVFGHGYGGGGHNAYMACMDYFASHGYYVFAYDATGTDNSEGDNVLGLPHQLIDMDYAIRQVSELPQTKGLPIVLWGHSWGGYTVTNELAIHPEVKAVITVSGFNYSMDLIYSWGCDFVGQFLTCYAYPYLALHQDLICGSISHSSAVNAFSQSDSGVMSVTATNDPVVPPKYGYTMWKEMYSEDTRFIFREIDWLSPELAHNNVFSSKEYLAWKDDYNENVFNAWLETLDYDYSLPENEERFVADKAAFLADPDTQYHRSHYINEELFDEMLAFYDSNIK